MEQAAILKSGEVVKLTGLINPKYTIYGFLNSFEAVINGVTKKFKETVEEDFRDADLFGQIDKDVIGGFYEEDFFLEYLIDKNKLYELKNHKYTFKLASANDEIIVKKLKVSSPYTDFCKIETYKWAYQPNVPIVDYGTWQIKIPNGTVPDPLEGVNVELTNNAMQFYSHKIGLFVTPLTDQNDKQAKAFLFAKIAILINSIQKNLFSQFLTEPDFQIYLSRQDTEWTNNPIFVNPTVEILEDYLGNLRSYYKSFYANQILVKNASTKNKFYWLMTVLSAEALAIVPASDKIELLYNLSKQNVTLTERNGGEKLALKIIESFTFESVSSSDKNDLLDDLVNFHNYITFQGSKGSHSVDSKTTLFEILYRDIDDNRYSRYTLGFWNSYNDRMKYIILLYKIWYNSTYNPIYPDPSYTEQLNAFNVYEESPYMKLVDNPDPNNSIKVPKYYNSITAPPFIIYESAKGSRNGAKIETTTNYSYKMVGKSIEVYEYKIESRKGYDDHYSDPILYGTYEFLQPITVLGIKPDLDLVETFTEFKDEESSENEEGSNKQKIHIIPAFLLFYMEDYSNLKKIDFGVMLAAQLALNLIGVGALADLQYLGYLSRMRFLRTAESVLASDAVLSWKAISGVVNAVEFTAINAMALNNYTINTTNDPTIKKVAQSANEYLFWITMFSMSGKPALQSKVTNSAFELNSIVQEFNDAGISIYRPGMTTAQIQQLDQALIIVKDIAGSKELVVNTMIQKLETYGNDASEILQKYRQIDNSAEKYAFYVDLGFFEDPAIRKIFNANEGKVIDNWRLCYANEIKAERKYLSFLKNEEYVKKLITYYEDINIRKVLEPIEITKKQQFLDIFDEADFLNFKSNPNFINEWEKYSFVSKGNDLSILSKEQKFKFFKSYENSPQTVVDRIKNGGLIKYYKIVDENPFNPNVHNSYIKSVDFLEDLRNTFTVKKQYPVNHVHHPGLQETIANHVKGSPVVLNHNGSDYIIGFTGMHADYAITEPNPITLIEATLPGGKKYYPGPLPTVNANIQTAIRGGTERPGVGVKDCEVWMWGYVTKTVGGRESLYLDTNGNPIKTWVKKSNSNKTTIFTGINEDKALIEITYARHNLILNDWIPHPNPGRPSNKWRGWSSEGVELHICIGTELMNPPTIMPSRTLPYGTVIPKNN